MSGRKKVITDKLGLYKKEFDEISNLQVGDDFRLPQYRKEVFTRFYEFHLEFSSHPGCVYYLFPFLFDELEMDKEQKLWLTYLNGVTQNLCTSYIIYKHFPNFDENNLIDKLEKWHAVNWRKLGYDTDRRYQKGHLVKMVKNYKEIVGKNQSDYFNDCTSGLIDENFVTLWGEVMERFFMFGRLSTFSYLEYLKILGLPIRCNSLFLEDISGSQSHRNGLCKVLGRDDWDMHKSNPSYHTKMHTPELIEYLKEFSADLLRGFRVRWENRPFIDDVNYFTLESTLCTYKSWFRKNRRYPNVYNDMFVDRIRHAEKQWGKEFEIFWSIRNRYLPKELRLEDNHWDVGLKPLKQNWFRETGQVVMMDYSWNCFKNLYKYKCEMNKQIEVF
tara:strand:+ start:967 stop:2127 length:1161 start_codon:yes stop_codon:yes gene_type:complete